jgi:hypothetical protein
LALRLQSPPRVGGGSALDVRQQVSAMKFPVHERKMILMFLGTFAVISLMFTTWAMVRISSWIVFHDSVEYQITSKIDGFLVEAFFFGHGGWLVITEGVCGIVFLGLLWHTLYRSEKKESSHDAA